MNFIEDKYRKTNEQIKELLPIYLKSINNLFSGIDSGGEKCKDIIKSFANCILLSEIKLCNSLKTQRDSSSVENLSILLSSMKYFNQKRVINYDYFLEIYDDTFPSSGMEHLDKEEFKELLRELQNTDIEFEEENLEEFATLFKEKVEKNCEQSD